MNVLTRRLLDGNRPVRLGPVRLLGEAWFKKGERVSVFVPVYFSANLKENNYGDMEDWLRALDDHGGGDLKRQVEQYMKVDLDEYRFNENGYTEEDFKAEKEAGVSGKELETFEGPWNRNNEGEEVPEDLDEEDWDAGFEAYLESEYGGNWDKFCQNYNQECEEISNFPEWEEVPGILEAAVADFNESFADAQTANFPVGLKKISASGYGELVGNQLQALDSDGSDHPVGLMLEAEFDTPPSEDQVSEFLKWVDGQMSDGWGEGYEQQEAFKDDIYEYTLKFHPCGARARYGRPRGSIGVAGRAPTDSKVGAAVKRAGTTIKQAGTAVKRTAREVSRRTKKAISALRGESQVTGILGESDGNPGDAEFAVKLKAMPSTEREAALDAWMTALPPGEMADRTMALLAAISQTQGAPTGTEGAPPEARLEGKEPLTVDQLEWFGFDRSRETEDGVKVGCSQCEAMVINGHPCHETGCSNSKREEEEDFEGDCEVTESARATVSKLLEGDGQPGFDLPPEAACGGQGQPPCCPKCAGVALEPVTEAGAPGHGRALSCPQCAGQFVELGGRVFDLKDRPAGQPPAWE